MGRAFQSPFAKPPGEGLSSATVNVLWGAFNIAVGYWLICQVGDFDLRNPLDAAVAGIGGLLMGVMLARWFGRARTLESSEARETSGTAYSVPRRPIASEKRT